MLLSPRFSITHGGSSIAQLAAISCLKEGSSSEAGNKSNTGVHQYENFPSAYVRKNYEKIKFFPPTKKKFVGGFIWPAPTLLLKPFRGKLRSVNRLRADAGVVVGLMVFPSILKRIFRAIFVWKASCTPLSTHLHASIKSVSIANRKGGNTQSRRFRGFFFWMASLGRG